MKDDFIIINMSPYDLILRMDWLTKYRASIDCYAKSLVVMARGPVILLATSV